MLRIERGHFFPGHEWKHIQPIPDRWREPLHHTLRIHPASSDGETQPGNTFGEGLKSFAEVIHPLVIEPTSHKQHTERAAIRILPGDKVVRFDRVWNVPDAPDFSIVLQLQ